MGKHGIEEQFYTIKTGDQTLVILFADASLKQKLLAENILEDMIFLKVDKNPNFQFLKIVDEKM
ncbi:MAG: hypothetical protein QM768_18840 [Agriterribacter sp.]